MYALTVGRLTNLGNAACFAAMAAWGAGGNGSTDDPDCESGHRVSGVCVRVAGPFA